MIDGPYTVHRKTRDASSGTTHYELHSDNAKWFGTSEGHIAWFLKEQLQREPKDHAGPYEWHVDVGAAFRTFGMGAFALLCKIKGKQQGKFSLYELRDIWGYSDVAWTSMMFHLDALFVDADPSVEKFDDFTRCKKDSEKSENMCDPIYEFVYVKGGIAGGRVLGNWTLAGELTAGTPLLETPSIRSFVRAINKKTPDVLKDVLKQS